MRVPLECICPNMSHDIGGVGYPLRTPVATGLTCLQYIMHIVTAFQLYLDDLLETHQFTWAVIESKVT